MPSHVKRRRYFQAVEVLDTERLLLKGWTERDREHFARLAADPEVMRYIGRGSPWGREKSEQDFVGSLRHWDEHGFGKRALIKKKTGRWVGFVELCYVGPGTAGVSEDEVEIGWWLTPRAWGRGLATEAAVALLDEGFGRVGRNRIIARMQPANVGSARVAQKIGMRLERETTGRNGEPVLIYALGRRDWRRARLKSDE